MKRNLAWRLTAAFFVAAVFLLQWTTSASDKTTASVTFAKDVAPILYKNCATCHRAGEIAPMSLLSYKDVRPWAKSIREVVADRKMPPWLADPHYGEFSNDRRLSQKEVDTIVAWVDSGAKEGEAKDLPAAPTFSDVGWKFGKPDVVLPMTVVASVPADGVVAYRHFVVPTNFTEDKYIQYAEIKRGDPRVVHHVIVSVREPGQGPLPPAGELNLGAAGNREGEARSLQQAPGQGQTRSNNPDGMLLGWAPGMSPLSLRDGQAKLVKKGSVLIFQMHYTTNGQASTDRTSIGLYFAKGPIEKRVITTGAVARNLLIPAGEPNYESKASFTFRRRAHREFHAAYARPREGLCVHTGLSRRHFEGSPERAEVRFQLAAQLLSERAGGCAEGKPDRLRRSSRQLRTEQIQSGSDQGSALGSSDVGRDDDRVVGLHHRWSGSAARRNRFKLDGR